MKPCKTNVNQCTTGNHTEALEKRSVTAGKALEEHRETTRKAKEHYSRACDSLVKTSESLGNPDENPL